MATPPLAFTQPYSMQEKVGEGNLILRDQNISVKTYRFLSFVNNERVVCDHIYFCICYYWYCYRRYLTLYTETSP
jgi:hypothetical protein